MPPNAGSAARYAAAAGDPDGPRSKEQSAADSAPVACRSYESARARDRMFGAAASWVVAVVMSSAMMGSASW